MSLNMHFTAPVVKKEVCEMGYSNELSLNQYLPPVINNDVCKKEFDDQSNVNQHLHKHSVAVDNSFINDNDMCKYEQSSPLLYVMNNHIQDVEKPFSSDSACKIEIDEQPSVDQHAQTVEMLFVKEEKCQVEYDEQSSLNQHISNHDVAQSSTSVDAYKQGLDRQLSLDQHLHHQTVDMFFVEEKICEEEEHEQLNLNQHPSARNVDNSSASADASKQKLDEQPTLNQHLHVIRNFIKEVCEEDEDGQLSLNQHLPAPNLDQPSASAFTCKEGLKEQPSFNQYHSSKTQILNHHRHTKKSLQDKEFVCDICLTGYNNKAYFLHHLQTLRHLEEVQNYGKTFDKGKASDTNSKKFKARARKCNNRQIRRKKILSGANKMQEKCQDDDEQSSLNQHFPNADHNVDQSSASAGACKQGFNEQPNLNRHLHAETLKMDFSKEEVCEEEEDGQLNLNQHLPAHNADPPSASAVKCKEGLKEQPSLNHNICQTLNLNHHLHIESRKKSDVQDLFKRCVKKASKINLRKHHEMPSSSAVEKWKRFREGKLKLKEK